MNAVVETTQELLTDTLAGLNSGTEIVNRLPKDETSKGYWNSFNDFRTGTLMREKVGFVEDDKYIVWETIEATGTCPSGPCGREKVVHKALKKDYFIKCLMGLAGIRRVQWLEKVKTDRKRVGRADFVLGGRGYREWVSLPQLGGLVRSVKVDFRTLSHRLWGRDDYYYRQRTIVDNPRITGLCWDVSGRPVSRFETEIDHCCTGRSAIAVLVAIVEGYEGAQLTEWLDGFKKITSSYSECNWETKFDGELPS